MGILFEQVNNKMKFATVFVCALVLAVSVSSYDLTPTQARKMRAQCLNECSADCPKNAINIMRATASQFARKTVESTSTTKLVVNVPPKFLENLASIVSEFAFW